MEMALGTKRRQWWALPKPGRVAAYVQARLHAPRLARPEVEQILAAYGLTLARPPQNLPFGWRSYNVVVHTDQGKMVLKRYRAGWPAATIAHEHSILRELERSAFPAPRLVHTPPQPEPAGARQSIVQHNGHQYALFAYLAGDNVAGSAMLPAQRAQLQREAGKALAHLHGQLRTFMPEGRHHLGLDAGGMRQRDLTWHLEALKTLRRQVNEAAALSIDDGGAREDARWLAAQADGIARRLQQLEEKAAAVALPQTVIHGDYGLHNLHFHASQEISVVDFELARREWRLVDLITVLSRIGLQQGQNFLEAYEQALQEAAPALAITEEEWRLLPDVWQLYRLRGAVQQWHNYTVQGDARRLRAARKRVLEGGWALQHRPELWQLRGNHLSGQRPLRVMMVVRLFYPWVGGAERQAHRLARTLLETTTAVELLTGWWYRGTARRELLDNIPVYRNFTFWHALDIRGLRKFSGYLYMLTLIWRLWRRRRHYDVIHVHGLNYHTFAAVLVGRWARRPVLVKLANSGPASDIKKMKQDQQLALAHRMLPTALQADGFVALNRAIVAELVAAGVPRQRICEIPNGVDAGAFTPKQNYALHRPARLLYVGRLHAQKGLDTLLHAIAQLREQLPQQNVNLRLVGDGPERQSLQALAASLDVAGRVEFAGLRSDIAGELQEADIFVLPSRAEGLSNALLEAMACALPVVVSDVPGNAEVIHSDENGLTFTAAGAAAGDPASLTAALCRLLQQQALREQVGRAARKRVEEAYSLESVARRYSTLYRELTGGRHPAGAPAGKV